MIENSNAVSDTSFWVNCFRTGLLPYVLDRYRLYVAPAVDFELPDTNPYGREYLRQRSLGVVREAPPFTLRVREYGAGEREAMSIARERPNWMLLLDDFRPYRACLVRDMNVLCSPLFAVKLYDEGALDDRELDDVLFRLEALKTVSPRLMELTRLRRR